MAGQTPRPDALRYIQCELPDIVEQLMINFEDEVSVQFQDFDDRLTDFIKNQLPAISASLDEQAEVRDQIIAGSPVKELSSMEEMEESLGLVSPKKKLTDTKGSRIDQRKLGAVGIVCINGRIWKMLRGIGTNGQGRLDPLRYLWNSVSGDYDAFISLGDSIAYSNDGEFLLLEKYIFSADLPKTQEPFAHLNKPASQYKYDLLWTTKVAASTSNDLKLQQIGYTPEQVLNVNNSRNPNDPIVIEQRLADIQLSVRKLTQLLLTPTADPKRTPPWINEFKLISEAILKYLRFRYDRSFTSSTFDPLYWEQVKADLSEAEMKELFEERIEVHDMLVPTTVVDLEPLFDAAFAIPQESNTFHTYLISLPKKEDYSELEKMLWDLGLYIFKHLIQERAQKEASSLQSTLQELVGDENSYSLLTSIKIPPSSPTVGQLNQILIGETNASAGFEEGDDVGFPTGKLVSDFTKEANASGDVDIINAAVAADAALENFKKAQTDKASSGLPTQDSGGGLLSRLFDPTGQFVECNVVYKDKKQNMEGNIGDATPPPIAPGTEVDPRANPDLNPGALYSNRIKEKENIQNVRQFKRDAVNQTIHKIEIPNHGYTAKTEVHFRLVNPQPGDFLPQPLEEGKKYFVSRVDKDSFGVSADLFGNSLSFQRKGTGSFEVYTLYVASKASARREVKRVQSTPRAQRNLQFNSVCRPKFDNAFTRVLAKLEGEFRAFIIKMCNILKQALLSIQDKIDALIAKAQVLLDAILARLERLLTFDLNVGGKFGIDSSILKCSWGLDFNLNFDLFGRLLTLLNEFLKNFSAPLRSALNLLNDLINKIICIPVRLLETLLGAVNKLLNLIGCSLKDIKLPAEIFDLMQLLLFTFDLRGLVLRKGYEAFNGLALKLRTQSSSFSGLTQFGSLCNAQSSAKAVSTLENALKLVVAAPTRASDRIGKQIDKLGLEAAGSAI